MAVSLHFFFYFYSVMHVCSHSRAWVCYYLMTKQNRSTVHTAVEVVEHFIVSCTRYNRACVVSWGPPVSFNKSAIFSCVCACIHVVAKEQKFGSNTKTPHEWQTKIPTPIYNTIAASKAEYIPSRLCLCGRVILVMNDVTCKRIGS